jgi:transcriptional regulator with XRE-family HTH domain
MTELIKRVDAHVGAKLREFRKERKLTQEELGGALGVSFQQVQKYERGTNRVSSGKLWAAALFLQRDLSEFYPAPPNSKAAKQKQRVVNTLMGYRIHSLHGVTVCKMMAGHGDRLDRVEAVKQLANEIYRGLNK